MNDFDSELRKQSIDSQIDMISNKSSVLIISENHKLFTKKLAEKKCTIEITETTNNSNNELIFDLQNFKNKKFQVILLDDTIDHITNPIEFLKQVREYLMPDGLLLCSAYNLFNSINRLRFLNGDSQIINSILKNMNLQFSSLESILLTLSESDLSIGTIVRVENKIDITSKLDFSTYTLTDELLETLTSDSESNTFYYVFTIINKLSVNPNTRRWISKFSKNLVTEAFKEVLSDYKLQYERHINYLKQTNREQYALMLNINDSSKTIRPKKAKISNSEETIYSKFQKELETDVLEDSKRFLQDSLREKDEFLDTALKQKDEYIDSALRDKDDVINAMQNSFAFRMVSKLDKLLGRKYKNK